VDNKILKVKLVLVLSLLGIASVFITIISDFILIGKPNSAYDFLMLGTKSMWDISALRLTIGAFVGVVILPFQLLGLVPVYYALEPAGKILPIMTIIVNAHTLLMGVAFHISYAFIGSGWTHYYQENANLNTSLLVNQFDLYWMILAVIMFVELLFCSIVYVIVVVKGKTLFPKWMAIFNPMGIIIMTFPLIFAIPYPVGGYVGPAYLNISTMIFFIITLTVAYKKMKQSNLCEK
jgi:hypothetical protein